MFRAVRTKQKPEDFVVREAWRFDESKRGDFYVYLMDKQKLSTLQAVERLAEAHDLRTKDLSFCGLKDKQGRTEQIIAVHRKRLDHQERDLRLKFLGRTDAPLSSANLTANRFVVTVRDLSLEEAERVPASVAEVARVGVINYFDSQRFGGVKHGQGFLAKDLARGRVEHALKGWMAVPSPLDRTPDARVKAFWRSHWGEWTARVPTQGAARYGPILRRLRDRPGNWVHAFRAIDKRKRALMVFEYQSFLWNEAVRRYLQGRLDPSGLLEMRYQAGRLLFPRDVRDPERARALAAMDFPLVGPDSHFDDPEVEKAVLDTLAREKMTLEALALPAVPDMGFKHEPRALIVQPGKLSVVDPRPDELNRGRLKVTLAFTLPPGAYATLVVKRTLWFASRDTVQAGGTIPPADPDFIPTITHEGLSDVVSQAHRSRRRPLRPSHGLAVEREAPGRGKSRRGGRSDAPDREAPPRPDGPPARREPKVLGPAGAPRRKKKTPARPGAGHRKGTSKPKGPAKD